MSDNRPMTYAARHQAELAAKDNKIAYLEGLSEGLEERLAIVEDSTRGFSPDMQRLQSENRVLRMQLNEWQTKYEECRKAREYYRKVIKAGGQWQLN